MKCDFPGGCEKELNADGFCSDHGNNKAWGPGTYLVLLTERMDAGYSDSTEFSNRGVFTSIEKIMTALKKEHLRSNIEHLDDGFGRGRFKVTAEVGSAFDACYDYTIVGLDKYID